MYRGSLLGSVYTGEKLCLILAPMHLEILLYSFFILLCLNVALQYSIPFRPVAPNLVVHQVTAHSRAELGILGSNLSTSIKFPYLVVLFSL